MGINTDDIDVRTVSFAGLDAEQVAGDLQPIRNARLLNPSEMLSRFRIDRGVEAGLSIDDLDVDRYVVDDELQQVLIAARELDLDGSPNQSWQGRHLINTRGCDLVMAPVGRVQESDRPDYQTVEVDAARAVLQPQPVGLRRGQDRAERASLPRRRDRGLRRHRRRADVVVRPPRRLRPGVPRLQRARVRGHRGRLADAVGPQRARPLDQAGAVPVLRRRPVPRRRRGAGGVGRRRLHDDEPLPLRPAHRQRGAAHPRQRAVAGLQLRPQQRQGRRRRLRRIGALLRHRPGGPDRQGVAGGVRRPVHAR